MQKYFRYIICVFIFCTIAAIAFMYGMRWMGQCIESYIVNVEPALSKKIGHTVQIGKVTANWQWLDLSVRFDDLLIKDNNTSIPLFKAEQSVATVGIWQTAINNSIKLSYLSFNKPKIVAHRDEGNEYSVIGLAGEFIPGKIPIEKILDMLGSDIAIDIKEGDFILQATDKTQICFEQVSVSLQKSRMRKYHLQVDGVATGLPALLQGHFGPTTGLLMELQKKSLSDPWGDKKWLGAEQQEFIHKSKINLEADLYGDLNKWNQLTAKVVFNVEELQLFPLMSGTIERTSIFADLRQGELKEIAANFKVRNLLLTNNDKLKSAAGRIYFHRGKYVDIEAQNVVYANDRIFNAPVHISNVKGNLLLRETNAGLQVVAKQVGVYLPGVAANVDVSFNYNNGNISDLILQAKTKNINIADIDRKLLHRQIFPDLTLWLNKAIEKHGVINKVSFDMKNKQINAALEFSDIEFKFLPAWPKIEKFTGNLNFTMYKNAEHGMEIDVVAKSGYISGADISGAQANITQDNNDKSLMLHVDGKTNTSLINGVKFLTDSPLRSIGGELQPLDPVGNMHLALAMDIPIVRPDAKVTKAKNVADMLNVKGEINIERAEMQLVEPWMAKDLSGKFSFTAKDFNANNLEFMLKNSKAPIINSACKGKVWSEATTGNVQVELTTLASGEHIKSAVPELAEIGLDGLANLKGRVTIPKQPNAKHLNLKQNFTAAKAFMLTSDLQGMAITLPVPLNKSKGESKRLTVVINENNEQHKMSVSYAGILKAEAAISRRKVKSAKDVTTKQPKISMQDEWNIDSLGIALGEHQIPANVEKISNLILVNGSVAEMDLNAWHSWVSDSSHALTDKSVNIDILANKLKLLGHNFTNVKVKYNTDKTNAMTKTLSLDGADIQGKIIMQGQGNAVPLEVDMSRLYLTVDKQHEIFVPKGGDNVTAAIIFSGGDIKLGNSALGKVGFNLLPKAYGYDINNITIENADFTFQGDGSVQDNSGKQSHFAGSIVSKDVGGLLKSWKLGDSIRKGNGIIDFVLSWENSLGNFDFSQASGKLNIDIKNGQLLRVNPGLGRIVSLLSLETIKRRIQLNFSDVVGEGFAFDKLKANLNLTKGVLTTVDDLTINGPSAKIALSGKAWIKTKAIDLKMNVISKASSTLSMAAAIAAGNPAVGAALWLADRVSPMQKDADAISYKYTVAGTWDRPQITEANKQNQP